MTFGHRLTCAKRGCLILMSSPLFSKSVSFLRKNSSDELELDTQGHQHVDGESGTNSSRNGDDERGPDGHPTRKTATSLESATAGTMICAALLPNAVARIVVALAELTELSELRTAVASNRLLSERFTVSGTVVGE